MLPFLSHAAYFVVNVQIIIVLHYHKDLVPRIDHSPLIDESIRSASARCLGPWTDPTFCRALPVCDRFSASVTNAPSDNRTILIATMADAVAKSLLSTCKDTLKNLSDVLTALDSIGALARLGEDGETMEALKVVGVFCQSLLLPSTSMPLGSELSMDSEIRDYADTSRKVKSSNAQLNTDQRVRGGAFFL